MANELKSKVDVSALSDAELAALIPEIEREMEKRKDAKKREAVEKMRAIAAEVGLSPEELLGTGGAGRRKRGRRGPIAWRHPDDSSLIYRGGKKPAWLTDLVASGREAIKVE
jgi:DNA-binding protein H-NS